MDKGKIPARIRQFNFVLIGENKTPIEKEWQKKVVGIDTPKLQEHLQTGGNYGVQSNNSPVVIDGKSYFLIVLDFDKREIQDKVIAKFPETFTTTSGSSKNCWHLWFASDNCKSFKILDEKLDTLVDIIGAGKQVIAPGSTHPSGSTYSVVKDVPIAFMPYSEIQALLQPYDRTPKKSVNPKKQYVPKGVTNETGEKIIESVSMEEILGEVGIDSFNNPTNCFGHESKGGKCFSWNNETAHCFHCQANGEGWNKFSLVREAKGLSDKETFDWFAEKAGMTEELKKSRMEYLKETTQEKKEEGITIRPKVLIRTYEDFKRLKKDRSFIVKEFLLPKTINMLYSPPTHFKSLVALGMAMCISTGREWLSFKTKKMPVLYLEGEANDRIEKERLEALHKGMGLRRTKFPLYILKGGLFINGKKEIDEQFLKAIKSIIAKKGIKVIFVDTLHRFAYYDENKADDINKLYMEVFQPLRDELGQTIFFLHHTNRKGGYRGSSDFLGAVDTAYAIFRNGKTAFTILNTKSKGGEIEKICGEIDFSDSKPPEYIKLIRIFKEKEEGDKLGKLKELTQKVRGMFKEDSRLKRKDIMDNLEMQDFEYKTRTLQRALSWLVENQYLDKDEKGVYSLILR